MSLKLKSMNSGKPKAERIPEGTYPARIVTVVDLGVQPQTDWKTGEVTDSKPRLLLTWELPTELMEFKDDEDNVTMRPRWISKEYTASNFDQSNIMKLINTLDPSISEMQELLDRGCLVNVGSTVNGNAKIVGVMPAPNGMEVGELANDSSFFDFDEPEQELFLSQPAWIQGKIMDADNYNGFADSWVA